MKNYFFPSFLHPPSPGGPTGMSRWLRPCCWSSPGWARRGVSRDGVSQAIPGDHLHLLERGRVGVGDRSQRGQSQIPALTLHPPLPRLPPAWVRWVAQGAHPHGVARCRHVPEGVFNKLIASRCCTAVARVMPTSENRQQPLLSAAHLGGECQGSFPTWGPAHLGHLRTHKSPHLHPSHPFGLCFLLLLSVEGRWLHF